MSNMQMFQAGEFVPEVANKRQSPSFWISRIVFIEDYNHLNQDPTKLFRMDRKFKRGLNIVYANQAKGGHGAGKTTLCQFIRYCLGEKSYGPERFQKALTKRFPFGCIGAEVYLAGRKWSVLRPVVETTDKYSKCGIGISVDDLALTDDGEKYEVFESAFHDCLLERASSTDQITMLPQRFLAWLSRDQEARYSTLHDWRRAASGSGIGDPRKDEAYQLIRHVLGLILKDEVQLRQELRLAEHAYRKAIDKRIQEESVTDHMRWKIANAFKLAKSKLVEDGSFYDKETKSMSLKGRKLLEASLEEAKHNLKALDEDESEQKDRAKLTKLKEKETELIFLTGQLDERRQSLEDALEVKRNESTRTNSKRDNLVRGHQDATEDRKCLKCNHLVSETRRMWAQYESQTDDGSKEREAYLKELQFQEYTLELEELEAEISSMEKDLNDLKQKQIKTAEGDLNKTRLKRHTLEAEINERRREISNRVASFQAAMIAWDEYQPQLDKLVSTQTSEKEAERARDQILDRMALGFKANDERRKLNQENFDKVTGRILGQEYRGRLDVIKDGEIRAIWQRSQDNDDAPEEISTALDSLKPTVFDLAVLLSSIEGKADGPGFLMHDSPREADLMESIYFRIFEETARWTGILGQDEAPFQYIITTTTAPPKEFLNEKWVNQPILDSTDPQKRLLKENL